MKAEQLYKVTSSIQDKRDAAQPRIPGALASNAADFGRALDTDLLPSDHERNRDLRWLENAQLKREVDRANVLAERLPARAMSFELAEDEEQPVVRILDDATREVLWQMSPTDFLGFMSAVQQTVGLFFDRLA